VRDERRPGLDVVERGIDLAGLFGSCAGLFHCYGFPADSAGGAIIPSSFVALVLVTAFEHGVNRTAFGLPVRTVAETATIAGGFPIPVLPYLGPDPDWSNIVLYAFILMAIGLIESIMTLRAVAELVGKQATAWQTNQECMAQGLGNLLCGFFGGMGGDAMIGQSTVNAMNGARGRLSLTFTAVVFILIVVALSPAIGLLPTACLTGIMMVIVLKTFHWRTFALLVRLPLVDSVCIVMVTVFAVLFNLAVAVLAGVVWSALVSAYSSGKLIRAEACVPVTAAAEDATGAGGGGDTGVGVEQAPEQTRTLKVYTIVAPLFFGSVAQFTGLFDVDCDLYNVVLDFDKSMICDFSAVVAVHALCKRYRSLDKHVTLRNLGRTSWLLIKRAKRVLKYAHLNSGGSSDATSARHVGHLDVFMPIPHMAATNDSISREDEFAERIEQEQELGDDHTDPNELDACDLLGDDEAPTDNTLVAVPMRELVTSSHRDGERLHAASPIPNEHGNELAASVAPPSSV